MQSLQELFDVQFLPLFLRSRSPRTADLYRTTIRNYGLHLARAPLVSDLNDDAVCRYLAALRQNQYSPHTVAKERNNMLAMWRFACRKGLLQLWPDVPADKLPRRIAHAWTREELATLFAGISRERGWIAGVPAAAWWTALHYVLWDSGERITAAMSLRWETVDLRGGWAIFRAETRKGGREDREARLAPDTIAALRAILLPAREEVFPWPHASTYLWFSYGRLLRRIGLPSDHRSKFHRMRRSVASHFESLGGNATELLGHTKREITRAYLDPRLVEAEQAVDRLFRPG